MGDLFGSDGTFNLDGAIARTYGADGEADLAPLVALAPGPWSQDYGTVPGTGFATGGPTFFPLPSTTGGWIAFALVAALLWFLLKGR